MALNAVSCRTNAQEPKMLEFGPAAKVTPEEAKDLDPSRWAKVKMQHIKDQVSEREHENLRTGASLFLPQMLVGMCPTKDT